MFLIKSLIKQLCISIILLLIIGCGNKKKSELRWKKEFYQIGSQSSPRTADLNNDGILDIVIGAARGENKPTDQGVLALNGENGELLWQQDAKDQVFGSATFHDITDDGVSDIFITGRSSIFMALNGSTGEKLWEYEYQFENDSILKYAKYNFYNSVLIPDQNENGYPELLTVNGGNVLAEPLSEKERFPGVLMILDSKTGEVLTADIMPDGKESYMSPIYFKQPKTGEEFIVFGSGGETISGNLYLAKLSDFKKKNLSKAKIIASEEGHGFIAPPSIADINSDGYYDIVAISHGSTAFAVNSTNQKVIWQINVPDTESSNGFAVGNFTEDSIPDFFTFVSHGIWPNNTGSMQIMIDGATGEIVYKNSLGCTGFSSPVVYDLNNDTIDEVIISINEFDCERGYADNSNLTIENKLIALDFKSKTANRIDGAMSFKNIFSTPWLGDLDNDGYLDIIHVQNYSSNGDLLSFLGMQINSISTSINFEEASPWGSYMGTEGDGIYLNDKN
ncbi:FG-GAP repeat protein [Aurantibacter crassamenti]|uniref:outer membrane protein assembly factor BamB family protein n=1 Tax=Aurantibacter crassamenti TaxID=1837375 RepID=UPI001939C7B5|nr:PQQ-binding-like beta-propeller repeat protein [Aurantibacter crassamenti]MBM1105208.1 FG-GAP repeat protein [Aurantibacter crassamenti]